MPRYDFRCNACNAVFEMHLPLGATKTPACPHCKAATTEKILTPPLGIHFKGSGFYKTDSGTKSVNKTDIQKKEDQQADTTTPPLPPPDPNGIVRAGNPPPRGGRGKESPSRSQNPPSPSTGEGLGKG